MKNLKQIIQEKLCHQQIDEKLIINKNSKIVKTTYTFDEFINLIENYLINKINVNNFKKYFTDWIKDYNKLNFKDVSKDPNELEYYKENIIKEKKVNFEGFYEMTEFSVEEDNNYFIAYLRTDLGDKNVQVRLGYIINKEYKNLDKVHLFKPIYEK